MGVVRWNVQYSEQRATIVSGRECDILIPFVPWLAFEDVPLRPFNGLCTRLEAAIAQYLEGQFSNL